MSHICFINIFQREHESSLISILKVIFFLFFLDHLMVFVAYLEFLDTYMDINRVQHLNLRFSHAYVIFFINTTNYQVDTRIILSGSSISLEPNQNC